MSNAGVIFLNLAGGRCSVLLSSNPRHYNTLRHDNVFLPLLVLTYSTLRLPVVSHWVRRSGWVAYFVSLNSLPKRSCDLVFSRSCLFCCWRVIAASAFTRNMTTYCKWIDFSALTTVLLENCLSSGTN